MTSINLGSQNVFLRYKFPATTSVFNQFLRNIIKPGIYKGLMLSNPSGNNITISPGKVWMNAPFTADNIGVSISFDTAITGLSLTSVKPLVYLRFEWQNVMANFAEVVLGDTADYANDVSLGLSPIIIGEGVFSGPTLTGFSYALRTRGSLDVDNGFALSTDVTPSQDWHVGNKKYLEEHFRGIRKEYEQVRNATGGTLTAFKVVKIIDDYSSDSVPAVNYVTSAENDLPVGIIETPFPNATTGFILRRGRIIITGLDGTSGVKGGPVYCDDSGNITLSITSLRIGTLLDTVNPAPVYIDIGAGSGSGSGTGQSLIQRINQAHSFIVGNSVYLDNSGVWQLALANSTATMARGIVSKIKNANNFEVTIAGLVELTTGEWDAVTGLTGGLVPGTEYYTSDSNPGKLVGAVPPAYTNPLLVARSSTQAMVQVGFVGANNTETGNDIVFDSFVGDGVQTNFTLSVAPANAAQAFVFAGGALQKPGADYSVSGMTLSFTTAPLDGTQIFVFSLYKTIFNTAIDQYVQRATVTLGDDASVNLNTAGAVFTTVNNGLYEIWAQNDPNTYALITLKDGTPPVITLRDSSSDVDSNDTDGFLCIFVSGNDVIIKNRLGDSKTFIIHRRI